MRRRSARVTKISCVNTGKPRLLLLRTAKGGFNGRGRQSGPMNGPTRLDWQMDGFLPFRQVISIPTFVVKEEFSRRRNANPLTAHYLSCYCLLFSILMSINQFYLHSHSDRYSDSTRTLHWFIVNLILACAQEHAPSVAGHFWPHQVQ